MVVICPATLVPDWAKISCGLSVSLRFGCHGDRRAECQALYTLELAPEVPPSAVGSLHSSSGLWVHSFHGCLLALYHLYLESGPKLCSAALVPPRDPWILWWMLCVPPPASACFAAKGSHVRFYSDNWPWAATAAVSLWRDRSILQFALIAQQSPGCVVKVQLSCFKSGSSLVKLTWQVSLQDSSESGDLPGKCTLIFHSSCILLPSLARDHFLTESLAPWIFGSGSTFERPNLRWVCKVSM